MRNRIVAVVLVVGAAVSAPAQTAAQDTEKGRALLADARKAIGGDERLRALKTVQVKGTFKRSAGNNTLEGDFEVFLEPPGRYRRNETTGNAGGPIGERVEAMNGTEVWQETSSGFPTGRGGFGGGGRGGFGGGRRDGGNRAGGPPDGAGGPATPPPAIDPERLREGQLRQRRTEMARLMLMWFLTTDSPVSWVGTAESPEGKADVLEVTPAEGGPTRVFLDATTHMPLMVTTTAGFGGGRGRRDGGPGNPGNAGNAGGRDPGRGPAQPITIETHLAEYKTVNGIMLPHLVTRGVNGQTNEEWEIKSYRINPNLKAGTFTK